MVKRPWRILETDIEAARELYRQGVSPLVARVTAARGMDLTSYKSFIDFPLDGIGDPMCIVDMDKAVERIRRAVADNELITVFGDYDADGITSTYIMTDYLKSLGARVGFVIPEREVDGYGLNVAALEVLKENGTGLIITVDSGITAVDEAELTARMGMDLIITDHHECKEVMPVACAIINTKRRDCPYTYKSFSGVGTAFKLICALEGDGSAGKMLERYGDAVALGTVADVMPLTGENRILVARGIEVLGRTHNHGLKALCAAVNVGSVTSGQISYSLAPAFNAASRVGSAADALRLLQAAGPDEAASCATLLCERNKQRQALEIPIMDECVRKIEQNGYGDDRILVLDGEGWAVGVIGIVAARLSVKYVRPAIVISTGGDMGKGSGRSKQNFNLFNALEQTGGLLHKYGGHALAVGLNIDPGKIEEFRREINKYVAGQPVCAESDRYADCEIPFKLLRTDYVEALSHLEPFGVGNEQPVFFTDDVEISELSSISGGKHTRFQARKSGFNFTALLFNREFTTFPHRNGDKVNILYTADINDFRNTRTVRLLIKSIV